MRKLVIFALTIALFGGAEASWYWPFGSGSDAVDEKPKRVSELVEPASLLIEEASDLAAEGKTDEAVEKYRKALAELDRIEIENPDRAKSVEFATLRNKRAYVNAAIDSLLLSQVKANAKVVSVSDTTDLERRLDRERWGKQMDKATVELTRGNSDAALSEFERAKAETTNSVQIAMAYIGVAGACCQKGAFSSAHRSLTLCRQKIERAGTLTDEEKRLASEILETLRKGIVVGHKETLVAGRRVCDDSARLETAGDLTTSNVLALANGMLKSLDSMQGRLSVLFFPAARNLSRVSSNLQGRVSAFLGQMASGEEKPVWNVNTSGFESALDGFDALSPEIKGVRADISSILQTIDVRKEEPKTSKEEKTKTDEKPRTASKPPQPPKLPKPSQPSRPLTRREQVMTAIEKGDFTTAERLIGEMLVEKPNGAVALNLKAAMEARQGKLKEAEETLDMAIMSNPRNHFAYYNMANLMLQVRPNDKSVAKRYYETGRTFGGPVDAHLEEVLK